MVTRERLEIRKAENTRLLNEANESAYDGDPERDEACAYFRNVIDTIDLALSALSREGEVVVDGYASADFFADLEDGHAFDLGGQLRVWSDKHPETDVPVTTRISRREVRPATTVVNEVRS